MNLVWFKKDLRVFDNQALVEASKSDSIALYIIEKKWLEDSHTGEFHKVFLRECLEDLKSYMDDLGIPFIVKVGEATDVLTELIDHYSIRNIYSHMETGLWWTFERDIQVEKLCLEKNVSWHQYKQISVIRKLRSRDTWNKRRKQIIERNCFQIPEKRSEINREFDFSLDSLPIRAGQQIQIGGRKAAAETLKSFLTERGEYYYRELSSPVTAEKSCSRISPYLSFGCLSMSEVHNALKDRARESFAWKRSYKAFENRLWWHCHFIQKLEDEPEIEFENVNRGFDGMREPYHNSELFKAWCEGETGYPFIDACMRSLKTTGWINFRMRALLVSFGAYQLWLHWKPMAEFLAPYFLDFEPGIHFSQFQMQSGVTGINTIRMYSPIKQSLDQDPNGEFIRKWVPELRAVDDSCIHAPFDAPEMLLTMQGVVLGVDYPHPIVDPKKSYKEAKDKIFEWRKRPQVREFSNQVLHKHGSRKNQFFPAQHREPFGNWEED